MSSQTRHRSGTPAEWLEDFAFVLMLFSGAAIIVTITVLLIVL
jgi:hypothetical protein